MDDAIPPHPWAAAWCFNAREGLVTFPTTKPNLAYKADPVVRFNAREGLVPFPTSGTYHVSKVPLEGFNAREGLVTFPTEANFVHWL